MMGFLILTSLCEQLLSTEIVCLIVGVTVAEAVVDCCFMRLDLWEAKEYLLMLQTMVIIYKEQFIINRMIQLNHLKKKGIEIEYQNTFLLFRSDFDSGNLSKAELNKDTNEIVIQAGRDRQSVASLKNWFYFSIEGQYEELNVKLVLEKCNILQSISKIQDGYRPVVRIDSEEWRRLPQMVEFETVDSILRMKFNVTLSNSKRIEIALVYPWTVTENQTFLNSLEQTAKSEKSIYFNKEIIIYSPQKRPVHLLSISSADTELNKTEDYLESLFPDRENQHHYKYTDKPIILIIARVHPGQVGSSHSCNGMLKFLVSRHKIAQKLRKQFYFWVIPILNPDGVFNGNNRMDALGQNLNRFYHLPDREKQPSCFAVKSLVESCRKQLYAFFDLHGHANKKSCFLYGNNIPLARLQAQSLLFAKILSLNCQEIDFSSCNFSKKHMSSKDKSDQLTKQGCARVVIHKWSGSPYCYTLETGLFKNIKVDDKGIERYSEQFYTIQTYQNLGQQMLISFDQTLSKSKKIDELRKEMVVLTSKLERVDARKSQKQIQIKKLKERAQISQEKTLCEKVNNLSLEHTSGDKPSLQKIEQPIHSLSVEAGKTKSLQDILRKNKQYMVDLEDEDVYD